ncbi:glycosyltransferase family 4 protein [Paraprevotella clara]|uniref:glycosyltransferase family 4 protein n=1 Tax=Paraprevotella clara TaxID=454154 RepID=UPI002675E361|nr:glycosyltransferase family 4 protein [Paraprevotella clara]
MKKILVVSPVQTPPVSSGSQKCIYEYCELLRAIGFEVYFLYIKGQNEVEKQLKNYWGDRLFIYKRNFILDVFKRGFIECRKKISGYNAIDDLYPIGLTHYVDTLQKKNNFDAIIINYAILSKLFTSKLNCKKILYAHDCLSFKKQRLNVKQFWIDLTPNQEAKGLQRCDTVLSIQENEAIYFKYLYPQGNIVTVYSNFKVGRQTITGNKNILFLSGKSILNVNGIHYFITEVFPLILEEEPEVQLVIGGSICDVLPQIENSNIKLLGRIDEEEKFYEMGDIAINPIYQGTGLKIKTFEALAYGKVTIVHPHSAEGIYQPQKAPVFIGHTPQEFAKHVVDALSDIKLRKLYSDKAVAYIQDLNLFIERQYHQILL